MQNLVTAPPVKKSYDFIDAIRGLAMMCIVADHCFNVEDNKFATKTINFWVYITDVQLVKLGTVTFFLLAGFLLGDKFADYSAWVYLKRRINTTFKPWLIWSLVFLYFVVKMAPKDGGTWNWIFTDIKTVYLFSNYWFIINFLICIGILLAFKKQLYSLKLGAVLLLFTLFYSVNIYYEWIFPMHTTAILGFVFFLWLGAQIQKRWATIENYIDKVSLVIFIAVAIVMLALAVLETTGLYFSKSLDPFNSLRITNILYSIAVFFLLVKINRYNWLLKFTPRETTYGIYLIHYIVIYAFLSDWLSAFRVKHVEEMSLGGMVAYQVSSFVIAYTVTFIIVKLINKFSIKWIIGR